MIINQWVMLNMTITLMSFALTLLLILVNQYLVDELKKSIKFNAHLVKMVFNQNPF